MNLKHLEIITTTNFQRGGQQVGNLYRGVSVMHKPTGLRAQCDTERSQQRNLQICLAMIEYGLAEIGWKEEP
jgi:peptide chain release factor 1